MSKTNASNGPIALLSLRVKCLYNRGSSHAVSQHPIAAWTNNQLKKSRHTSTIPERVFLFASVLRGRFTVGDRVMSEFQPGWFNPIWSLVFIIMPIVGKSAQYLLWLCGSFAYTVQSICFKTLEEKCITHTFGKLL